MNEIPELKNDYAFLKKFDARNKVWRDYDGTTKSKKNEKMRSNFLLHPKQFSSDSECSSVMCSPHKLLSSAVRKSFSSNEANNNCMESVSRRVEQVSVEESVFIVESWMGDEGAVAKPAILQKMKSGGDSKIANNTQATTSKKISKMTRPSSTRFESFDRKFTSLVERSLKLVNGIREIMEKGIPAPDGEEDFSRRAKRLQEFSSRFSRVYLYPLVRHTDELSMGDKLGAVAINQKILYSQQVILQGLQAYYNHLPSSVGKCCSDKLRSLLDQALYLCQLYESLKNDGNGENNEFVNAMRVQTELLLETIATFDLKIMERIRKSSTNTTANKSKKALKKNKSKLAMYSVSASFRKDAEWRRAVESLAKKRFNVKSKYRTATFKHRPPVEKARLDCLPSKMKLFPKRSSGILKNTPMKSPIKEDDIKTMVEMEDELDAPPNSSVILNHENSIASGEQQLVRDCDRGICEEMIDEGNVKKALEVLRKFLGKSVENQSEFLEKIATEVGKRKEQEEKIQITESKKKLKEPIVTVTGTKNAKLICIRDDNSIVELEDEDHKKDKEIMTEVEIERKSSETQTEDDLRQENKNQIRSRSTIKISRLPKNSQRLLTVLPKEYAISIIQYKLRYSHFHKQNPMYRKSANIQPWILMGRISDEILDYILQSITSELEVNEILENLYNAEFQY